MNPVKKIAKSTHAVAAQSAPTTRLYISLIALILRQLPNIKAKYQVLNSLNAFEWPKTDLPAQTVHLGSKVSFKIYPHFNEFDLEAVVSRDVKYEHEVFQALEPHAEAADAIVEIGANVGIYSLYFAHLLNEREKPGYVFAFEPSSEAYLRLLKNIELNQLTNIQTFNVAVSDKTEILDFFEPKAHLTNGSLIYSFASHFSSEVKTRKVLSVNGGTLQKLIKDYQRILIKIDVEGAEDVVLKGLKPLIREKLPRLAIEVLPEYERQLNKLTFLQELGYSLFNITSNGLVEQGCFGVCKIICVRGRKVREAQYS